MDGKTYEYMNERVDKYRKIGQEISQIKKAASACDNPSHSTPQLYIGGNYHILPTSVLKVIKAHIEEVVSQKEAERESI